METCGPPCKWVCKCSFLKISLPCAIRRNPPAGIGFAGRRPSLLQEDPNRVHLHAATGARTGILRQHVLESPSKDRDRVLPQPLREAGPSLPLFPVSKRSKEVEKFSFWKEKLKFFLFLKKIHKSKIANFLHFKKIFCKSLFFFIPQKK